MDRQSWTEADQAWAHREHYAERMGWFEIIRPARYREQSPSLPAPLPPRPRARHVAPNPDDEEPSPVRSVTVYVIPKSTRRLRGWVVVVLVAGAMYVVVTVIRSMMGAT